MIVGGNRWRLYSDERLLITHCHSGNTSGAFVGLRGAHTLIHLSVNGTFQANTPFRIDTNLSGTTQSGSLVFDLAYFAGQTDLFVQMFGIASCGGVVNRGSEHCVISLDYLGALTLLGTAVLDSDMNIVSDAILISDSGFDYQSGTITDSDDDGIPDADDNCPNDPNPGQENHDGDDFGDVCDDDIDGDLVNNDIDNCPTDPNAGQEDFDSDDIGDACDDDIDGDGVANDVDFCPVTTIPEGVPWVQLRPNRWALIDDDVAFDTVIKGKGNRPNRSYLVEDTAGCSCEQIIEMQGLGNGHTYHGCSISAMDDWVELVNP